MTFTVPTSRPLVGLHFEFLEPVSNSRRQVKANRPAKKPKNQLLLVGLVSNSVPKRPPIIALASNPKTQIPTAHMVLVHPVDRSHNQPRTAAPIIPQVIKNCRVALFASA
jgi:hypothetical protein